MFDYVYFLRMVSIFGMFIYGFLSLCSICSWYYHECTKRGSLEKMLVELKTGRSVVGYKFGKRFILFLTFVLIFISIK